MLATVLATVAFGLVHSALASRPAKRAVEAAVGTRRRNAFYRPFFLVQSVVTLGFLTAAVLRVPSRTVYEVKGPGAVTLQAGRALGLLWATWAALRVGLPGLTGLRGLVAFAQGAPEVPREAEAQGPAPGTDGVLDTRAPFTFTRHPLNFAPVPVLWLAPRMTTRWLAFSAAATAYLVAGSRHEEARLVEAYGAEYESYRSGVSFYVPAPRQERPGARPALRAEPPLV